MKKVVNFTFKLHFTLYHISIQTPLKYYFFTLAICIILTGQYALEVDGQKFHLIRINS